MRSTMNANQYLGVKFRAMNTEMAAIGRKEGPLPYWQRPVIGMFSAVEQAASRFRVDSGLTHLNRVSVGEAVPASLILYELLQRSWQLAAATNYLFQPYIGNVMRQMGYDRSFELLEYMQGTKCDVATPTDLNFAQDIPTLPIDMEQVSDPNALTFDGKLQTVTRHVDRELDLGGIGKGWTADRASALMRGTFEVNAGMVDAGGDLVVWTEGDPWCIGIQDPHDEEKEVLQLWVKKAGIATSNIRHRRWIYDNQEFHHIVNGRTGLTAASDVVQATVLAPRADEAEIAAKILCMLGSEQGPTWMSSHFPQFGYILIKNSGETLVNREVTKYAIKVV